MVLSGAKAKEYVYEAKEDNVHVRHGSMVARQLLYQLVIIYPENSGRINGFDRTACPGLKR
jgi:hypothetical protein